MARGQRVLGADVLPLLQCLHRDLAARNVLIGDDMVAKVANFGLARDISSKGHYVLSSRVRRALKTLPPQLTDIHK